MSASFAKGGLAGILLGLLALQAPATAAAMQAEDGEGAYADMPQIPPIGARIGKYLDVPPAAMGAAGDPSQGYRLEDLGQGLYMITNGGYQSMFLVHQDGVIVVDAPPSYAPHIRGAIAEVTDKPITHLVYSHAHADHIGGASQLGPVPVIIAHSETKRLLLRAKDPTRPPPTVTFDDQYVLRVGGEVLELSYHGVAHDPGNIFIYAPTQKTLMVVDMVSPGWMPFRRLSIAQDIPGYYEQVALIETLPFETLVGGHVARTGTHADVQLQLAFMADLKTAAGQGLKTTQPGQGLDPRDAANPWAGADDFLDRAAIACVNSLQASWSRRLAGYDAFIWDQCYAVQQSLLMD